MGKKRVGLNVNNEEVLLSDLNHYYDLSVTVLQDFGGPSVYFHQQALQAQQRDFLGDRHIEMIYATLASWGMHRMGDPEDTKAKMVDFELFRTSILEHRDTLSNLRQYRIDGQTQEEYSSRLSDLRDIYFGVKVSISESTLVAHAKTLAHILPDLLPPIDRQYTVRFFTQDTTEFFTKNKNSGKWNYRLVQIPGGTEAQFNMYVDLCCKIKSLFDECRNRNPNLFVVNGAGFNTSYPKIIDNLIMAFVKTVTPP